MHIISRHEEVILDGSIAELASKQHEVIVALKHIKINLSNLTSINQITQDFPLINPEGVAEMLGVDIVDFDGIKIFHGADSGLKLQYLPVIQGDKKIALIFSFGEIQPGRMICQFEAAIS